MTTVDIRSADSEDIDAVHDMGVESAEEDIVYGQAWLAMATCKLTSLGMRARLAIADDLPPRDGTAGPLDVGAP